MAGAAGDAATAAAAAAGGEFVEGWLVAQVLGEGAYGEVRLLVHARSGAAVALKAVRGEAGAAAAAREAALHRALKHPHVLRCLGERAHQGVHYLFLEYAQGGELFDRIEPDAGMPQAIARRYWRQLLAGLGYLHSRGVAHRDLKPENLLLDNQDRLKISDFGMATLFRHGSRERLLTRVCGTLPYAAPEVLTAPARPYRAPPADVWAAGVVLVAMLAGELPWERAGKEEPRFAAWKAWVDGGSGAAPVGAWRRLRPNALALVRRALQTEPSRRAQLAELEREAWLREPSKERVPAEGGIRGWASQPAAARDSVGLSPADMDDLLSYSQPAHADDLLVGTQLTQTDAGDAGEAGAAWLVRRMTRVWLRCDEAAALAALCDALRERRYTWRQLHPRTLAIECGPDVRMRAWAVRAGTGVEPRAMLEFRRSRGCGLEFKRRFLELRAALAPMATPPPPLHAHLAQPVCSEPMDES